jgi:hypothetical protein
VTAGNYFFTLLEKLVLTVSLTIATVLIKKYALKRSDIDADSTNKIPKDLFHFSIEQYSYGTEFMVLSVTLLYYQYISSTQILIMFSYIHDVDMLTRHLFALVVFNAVILLYIFSSSSLMRKNHYQDGLRLRRNVIKKCYVNVIKPSRTRPSPYISDDCHSEVSQAIKKHGLIFKEGLLVDLRKFNLGNNKDPKMLSWRSACLLTIGSFGVFINLSYFYMMGLVSDLLSPIISRLFGG